jgi:hypothetical protein
MMGNTIDIKDILILDKRHDPLDALTSHRIAFSKSVLEE